MNRGDGLASGAKSASFTAADKRMTKQQWDAMFEPEINCPKCGRPDSEHSPIEHICPIQPSQEELLKEVTRI